MDGLELVVRLDYQSPPLVAHLRETGMTAHIIRGGTIIHLESVISGYRVPELLESQLQRDTGTIRLQIPERGGKDVGFGTIVCGLSGCKIRPYWSSAFPKVCGEHARFTGSKGLITVTYRPKRRCWTISRYLVKRTGNLAEVLPSILWQGCEEVMPSHVWELFGAACVAAQQKAECPRCVHAHFALPFRHH
ncbi:MAG: hypothetical protein WC052_00665 [Patescibacteria group bacterium]|jgi:hypothetical protein